MKEQIMNVIKNALVVLLIILGIVLLITILKTYAPKWTLYILAVISLLWIIIDISVPKYHYWSYIVAKNNQFNFGVIKSRSEKAPIMDMYKKDLFINVVILNIVEIDKKDYEFLKNKIQENEKGREN
jgi:hypothetical protein